MALTKTDLNQIDELFTKRLDDRLDKQTNKIYTEIVDTIIRNTKALEDHVTDEANIVKDELREEMRRGFGKRDERVDQIELTQAEDGKRIGKLEKKLES